MYEEPALYLITGIMAAGKSTVAQALAGRFPRSVHLRGDHYRRSIVGGRRDMSADDDPEARAQLDLRYRLAAASGDRYVEAGFVVVAQDVVLGPVLTDVVGYYRSRPLALIVLTPSVDEVARRERLRAKKGYHGFTPDQLDEALRTNTPQLGLWLDTTKQTPEQTVDTILERRAEAIVGG